MKQSDVASDFPSTGPRGGFTRLLDLFFQVVSALGDLALLSMLIAIFVEVMLRAFSLGTLLIADEMAASLLVATTFLGLSTAVRQGALFRFEGLYTRIPDRIRPIYDQLLLLFALGISLVIGFYLFKFVGSTLSRGTVSDGMVDYPLWIPQVVMPLGFTFLVIALLEQLFLARPPRKEASDV